MFRTFLLATLLTCTLGCKSNKVSSVSLQDVDKKAVVADWYLLSVDNSIKIFTSNNQEVPPRRGYESMTFRADGTCSRTLPGPTDRPETTEGTWKWSSEKELTLEISGTTQVLRINKLLSTRLELTTQD